VLPILAGTTVDFVNSDPLSHNVFSVSKPKRFNLGLYPAGQVRSVRFDKPGIVEVLCNVHLEMSAYIIVLKNPFFTTTSSDGTYRLENVPPGRHVVGCWRERGGIQRAEVSVSEGGVHTIDFTRERSRLRALPEPGADGISRLTFLLEPVDGTPAPPCCRAATEEGLFP